MNYIFYIVFAHSLIQNSFTQGTYKAAVVEYATKTSANTPINRVLENVEEYVNYIQQAADDNVDIIVFPENGLTDMDVNTNNIEEFSMEVPDSSASISPCAAINGNYSKALIDLSCTAQTHRLYVVVNLIERFYQNITKKNIYHNTNVVFNREGVVIARFRKINLFGEEYMVAGNQTVTFKTDFGVTFGIFTCNDILFANPSLDVLTDSKVTDIIYPVAWFSEIPFLAALSVQHGYAFSNGVNLLAAGLDDPQFNHGGSGIYLANGQLADVYISGATTSKMLIADVPKHARQNSNCQKVGAVRAVGGTRNIFGGELPDISSFKTIQENMKNYTFKSLNFSHSNISETVCNSNDRKCCCSINMTISRTEVDMNYAYKLAIFNGGRYLGMESIGSRSCGLIACLNDSTTSCGLRHTSAPQGVIFDNISLTATYLNEKNAEDRPSTLNHDLKPMSNYTFCKQVLSTDKIEVSLTTERQSSLLTFGIFGRVFNNDNMGTGVFSGATFNLINPYIVFVISITLFLMQD